MRIAPGTDPLNELIKSDEELLGMILIWGDMGTGKTTLANNIMREILNQGRKVVFINNRPHLRINRLVQMLSHCSSINLDNLIIYSPASLKELFHVVLNLKVKIQLELDIRGKSNIGLIIVDSFSFLKQLETPFKDAEMKYSRRLAIILKTLDKIREIHRIPIVLTESSTYSYGTKTREKSGDIPLNPKTMDYFTSISLKIERSSQSGERLIIPEKHIRTNIKPIRCAINDQGFSGIEELKEQKKG